MRTPGRIVTALSLALCVSVAPAIVALDIVVDSYIAADLQAVKDAERAEQLRQLDLAGDNDGEGEHQSFEDRTTMSEVSIYWLCESMGNKRCE